MWGRLKQDAVVQVGQAGFLEEVITWKNGKNWKRGFFIRREAQGWIPSQQPRPNSRGGDLALTPRCRHLGAGAGEGGALCREVHHCSPLQMCFFTS